MTLDLDAVLYAVADWPAADRRILWEHLGDGLSEAERVEPLSDELKAELDRRLELYKDNPTAGEPWDVVYARLRSRS
jgi:putative addiction module component (TIGR02574 family)